MLFSTNWIFHRVNYAIISFSLEHRISLKASLCLKSLGFLRSSPTITLYSHCNLSREKNSPQNKRENSLKQAAAYKIYKVKSIYIYISWLCKNYSRQVKHTFWQLWSLWYVSVHWNAGTESQTGLHHGLLEEWEHCAKYRRKKN